jgi:periplasmic protein TonB
MAMTPDLVSSTIVARSREPEGLGRMVMVSAVGHVVVFASLLFLPMAFGARPQEEVAMTISLTASAPGADTGGLTSMSRSAVQQVAPKPELPKPTPKPPPPKTPEVVEPIAKPTKPVPTTKQSSTSTRPAPPTTGETVRTGQSKVDTGSPSNEGGLSTGGMGASTSQTGVAFCDPQYFGQMMSLIHRYWPRQQGGYGAPVVRFVIQRDGTLANIAVQRPSGSPGRDLEALRAVTLTKAIPPLPACYPHADYTMSLTFEYIR